MLETMYLRRFLWSPFSNSPVFKTAKVNIRISQLYSCVISRWPQPSRADFQAEYKKKKNRETEKVRTCTLSIPSKISRTSHRHTAYICSEKRAVVYQPANATMNNDWLKCPAEHSTTCSVSPASLWAENIMQSAVCSVHNTWYIYIKKINKESVISNDFKEMEIQNAAKRMEKKANWYLG